MFSYTVAILGSSMQLTATSIVHATLWIDKKVYDDVFIVVLRIVTVIVYHH